MFIEAQGAVVKDSKGRDYLDLLCSHGCATLIGYNHPAVVEEIKEQAGKMYALAVVWINLLRRLPDKPDLNGRNKLCLKQILILS
jgi:acetylornithine/succinyldiaminopimelate/putrescine aminotransferase